MLDEQQYEYDAFVMYSQRDSAWVIHELRPRLETDENLRLCIHQTDFLPGQDIVENIVESIEASRKCLLIVSNAFAESNWCQFEMAMAQTSTVRTDRKNVVLVLLEEIAEINITPRLRLQMAQQTYVEWTNNPINQQLFWKLLTRAIKKPTLSILNSQPLSLRELH